MSSFEADSPWHYPSPRNFCPRTQHEAGSKKIAGSNYDAKLNKFMDRYMEPNANGILHTLEKSTSVYRNAEWAANLRGDRKERIETKGSLSPPAGAKAYIEHNNPKTFIRI